MRQLQLVWTHEQFADRALGCTARANYIATEADHYAIVAQRCGAAFRADIAVCCCLRAHNTCHLLN